MAASGDYWSPLRVPRDDWADVLADGVAVRVANLRPPCGRETDSPARWLSASVVGLGCPASVSAAVSYAAVYRMVLAVEADGIDLET